MTKEVEIIPVAGYSDFGRNMTCVRVGREAVIFDMGIKLDRVLLHEDLVFDEAHPVDLQELGAIPDDRILKNLDAKVVAIVIGHGHLDHVGAVAKLAGKYKAPIYGTPYTIRIIEQILEDQAPDGGGGGRGRGGKGGKGGKPPRAIPNKLVTLKAGERTNLTNDLDLEFVHTTHSIPDTVFPVLHTPRGAVMYANDFKFDNTPVIGKRPDYDRLKELAMEGVLALIVESTNAREETKTPSEMIARDMLRDYLHNLENERNGIIVSTFSSHIARMKSIADFGTEMGREVLFLGRSMEKYTTGAADVGLFQFEDGVKTFGYGRSVHRALKKVMEDKSRYLVAATGHQGEPGSLLTRIANKDTDYRLETGDHVIFSAHVIPHPVNRANRHQLETKLNMQQARIIKGAHVSGHACREDHYELLRLLEPQHVFPAHGTIEYQSDYVQLAERLGYRLNETAHVLRNHQRTVIPK